MSDAPQEGEMYLVSRGWRCHTQQLAPELMQVVKRVVGRRSSYLVKLLHNPTYKSTFHSDPGFAVLGYSAADVGLTWVKLDTIIPLVNELKVYNYLKAQRKHKLIVGSTANG